MRYLNDESRKTIHSFISTVFPVTESDFETICRPLRMKSYKKGELILNANQTESKNSFVINGVVHQYVFMNDSKFTMDITVPGMIFSSFISYVEQKTSNQIQEAITDVETIYLEKSSAEKLFKTSPAFTYIYYKLLEQIHLKREKRTLLLQTKSAYHRFVKFKEEISYAGQFLDEVPQKLIARYLHLTPETYSRVRKQYLRSLSGV